MLNDSRSVLRQAPWTMIFPGLALTITVFGLNLLGDGLRDLLDPRLRRR
jgi:peptide/nickel transport system permease protein